jgi:hypothetical protein
MELVTLKWIQNGKLHSTEISYIVPHHTEGKVHSCLQQPYYNNKLSYCKLKLNLVNVSRMDRRVKVAYVTHNTDLTKIHIPITPNFFDLFFDVNLYVKK